MLPMPPATCNVANGEGSLYSWLDMSFSNWKVFNKLVIQAKIRVRVSLNFFPYK